jgi:hypothetical protein
LVLAFIRQSALDTGQPAIAFVWLTALATVYELIYSILFEIDTTYWFQAYSFLEFIAIYYFYSRLLKDYKPFLKISLLIFILVYLVSFFFWSSGGKFITQAINQTPVTLFVIACSFLWFKVLFKQAGVPDLWKHPDFYFVGAFLIYYGSTFFLFLLSDSIFNSKLHFFNYWFINVLATLVLRVLMSLGVWQMKEN